MQDRWQVGLGTEVGGKQRPESVLTVCADVEEAHLETNCNGNARDVVPGTSVQNQDE